VGNFINILYDVAIYLPSLSLFNPDKENTGALAIVGYFVNIIGIISSIPTLLTGFKWSIKRNFMW
jgi:hypothetical protein